MGFKDGRFKCFACGMGGTVIDFVSNLFDLPPLDAAKKLNTDFSLGLDLDRPTAWTMRRVDDGKRLLTAFEVWERQAFKTLCDYLSLLEHNKKTLAPQVPADMDEPHQLFIEACHETDRISYLIDVLIYGDFDEKLEFMKSRFEEVSIYGILLDRQDRAT